MTKIAREYLPKILKTKLTLNANTGAVIAAEGYGRNQIVTIDNCLGSGNLKKYRREYITTKYQFDFDNYKLLKTKRSGQLKRKKNNPNSTTTLVVLPDFPSNVTHQEIWDWQQEQYLLGYVDIHPKKRVNGNVKSLIVPTWLIDESKKRNRYDDVKSFASGLPFTNKSKPILDKLLNLIKSNTDKFFKYLGYYSNKLDWKYINDPFLDAINSLSYVGAGETEILAVLLIKGASMQGGSTSFDLLIQNDFHVVPYKSEVKSNSNAYTSFRLSKSSTAKFNFFYAINDICTLVKNIFNEYSEEEILKYINPEEFKSLKDIVVDSSEISLNKKWKDIVEFNDQRLRQLQLFLYYFHDITTRNQKLLMFMALRKHPYIIEPEQLYKDLNNVIQLYFDDHDIDDFTIIRNKEIMHLTVDDLSFAKITSGEVKIIEKKRSQDRSKSLENIAFKKWKKDKSISFSEVYNDTY
jgi:hypothetical protein